MYTFNKEKHIHELDGKPLIGVTSALQIIAKPQLIQWSANMAVDYIQQNSTSNPITEDEKQIGEMFMVTDMVLKEARTAHRRKKEEAGGVGTLIHSLIESWIKEQIIKQ